MRLLIIGHLEGYISAAGKIALQKGAKVLHCEDTETALAALRGGKGADVVMCDVKQNLAGFISALKEERITIPVVACGVGSDSVSAVKAIKAGAKEYVPLPPDSDLIAAILEAVSVDDSQVVAVDPAMQRTLKLANQLAPSEASILITGESGTGKEVMSRYIHNHSKRKNNVFVAVNCAAIPETLLESELFGYEKGAFTGAVARRIGKFEEATGGTILLDEITEMHPSLQAKLLRVLQEKMVDRIGGKEPIKVDVRVIATSNRDMDEAVKTGQFREDLYYRLNVAQIRLPALRERPQDILPMAKHFVQKYAALNGVPVKPLSAPASQKLQAANWRGNVRELENALHRAVLISLEPEIEADAIHTSDAGMSRALNETQPVNAAGQTLANVERQAILNTLNQTLGNHTAAAKILGISIRILRQKLKTYDMSRAEKA